MYYPMTPAEALNRTHDTTRRDREDALTVARAYRAGWGEGHCGQPVRLLGSVDERRAYALGYSRGRMLR